MPSPDDSCKGCIGSAIIGGLLIDSQLSSDAVNHEDGNNNRTPGIRGLKMNNDKILIEVEAENVCVGSHRENRRIVVGDN